MGAVGVLKGSGKLVRHIRSGGKKMAGHKLIQFKRYPSKSSLLLLMLFIQIHELGSGDVAQPAECLPNRAEVLVSITSTP